MAFRGWPAAAVVFFDGLEADNSRSYWQAHKATYDADVRGPLVALLDELGDEFGPARVSRPNRDTRFSHDKSPYKTSVYGMLEGNGYVNFSADGIGVGSGLYAPAPDQLERYRRAVADDASGEELVAVAAGLRAAGLEVRGHDELKTAPRGYPKDHPRIDLLRQKGLIAWKHFPWAKWQQTPKAAERVRDTLRAARPLVAWLDRNVGPTTLSERR